MLSKIVGSSRAKARMARRGVKSMTPRNKEKTWAVETARESVFWDEFEDRGSYCHVM